MNSRPTADGAESFVSVAKPGSRGLVGRPVSIVSQQCLTCGRANGEEALLPSLQDQRFLITGGTGSFGQTMLARLLAAGAAEVRVLSRDEAKQDDLRRRLRDDRVRFYVGDVRDLDSVNKAAKGVGFVFHAAALKQVPSCEFFPLEAIRTNVLGSANVVDACERNDVASVVFL